MVDLPSAEEEMPPSEGDINHTPSQQLSQEAATEAEATIRKSSRRWKASARDKVSREQ